MKRRNTDETDRGHPPWTASMKPAPGELRILQAFVNSVDRQKGTDELADPWRLAQWLALWKLCPESTPLTADDLERAVTVREALYALIRAKTNAAAEPPDLETVNRAASRCPLTVRFEADGTTRLEPFAEGLDGGLGRLFGIADAALRDGAWSRLKVCGHPDAGRSSTTTRPIASAPGVPSSVPTGPIHGPSGNAFASTCSHRKRRRAIRRSQIACLQRQKAIRRSQIACLQRQRAIRRSQTARLQRQKAIRRSHCARLQRRKATRRSQIAFIERDRTMA